MSEDSFEIKGTETLTREVAVRIADGDGRTLVSRLVPYGEVATVNDGMGAYKEMFSPGAFRAQMRAVSRIKGFLNYRHRRGFGDQIGHIANAEDRPDGLYGELRVKPGAAGDDALYFVREGILDKLSVEFEPVKHDLVAGVVVRTAARLVGVGLVPEGAYGRAEVLAMREEDEVPFDLDDTERVFLEPPAQIDPELQARLARFVDMTPEPTALERLDRLQGGIVL